jgi:hypothetical protein
MGQKSNIHVDNQIWQFSSQKPGHDFTSITGHIIDLEIIQPLSSHGCCCLGNNHMNQQW